MAAERLGAVRSRMITVRLIVFFILLLVIAIPLWAADEQVGPGIDYQIGPGDVLDISIWKDEALTRTLLVMPDGTISFPLIGTIKAEGKTIGMLREEMIGKITQYVNDPILSVEVKQVNSMLIYVIGRVNKPDRFVLNTNINVLQALSMAGGLNPFAIRDKIKIFRHDGGKTRILDFRYDDVTEGKRLEQNIWLKRGDVIVVP